MDVKKCVQIIKAIADETRFKIVLCITEKEEKVGMIAEHTNMSISAISHQLRLLREWNIVRFVRKGKEVYYSLSDQHVKILIEQVISHAQHS